MAKTNKEFVASLAEMLETKMKAVLDPKKDREEVLTAVCEAKTVLCILEDFLELEKELEKEKTGWNQHRGPEDSDEADDYESTGSSKKSSDY